MRGSAGIQGCDHEATAIEGDDVAFSDQIVLQNESLFCLCMPKTCGRCTFLTVDRKQTNYSDLLMFLSQSESLCDGVA